MSPAQKSRIEPIVESHHDIVLAVHGGASAMAREKMNATEADKYLDHLNAALQAGYKQFKKRGSSIDAVETAIRYLEDCPLFNAGRGAVLTEDGKIELDASIMDGKSGMAGAVACVTIVKNPVSCARAVMEESGHVLIVGKGADQFARKHKLEIVDPSYFVTKHQWDKFELGLNKQTAASSNGHAPTKSAVIVKKAARPALKKSGGKPKKYGTVGAVARDAGGNLAAATSTGGIINQHYGRVGDSPIVGAGVYADNATCAVSCTGEGEFFMRSLLAYDIAALIKYKELPLADAAYQTIHLTLTDKGGHGGAIVLNARGECVMPFNTAGMFRGCITSSGKAFAAIFD